MLRTGRDIGAAVAVEVGDDHLVCAVPIIFEQVFLPCRAGVARVFIPEQPPRFSPRRGCDIHVAIAVQVAGNCFDGIAEKRIDAGSSPAMPNRAPTDHNARRIVIKIIDAVNKRMADTSCCASIPRCY